MLFSFKDLAYFAKCNEGEPKKSKFNMDKEK